MSDYIIKDTTLTGLADGIRALNGVTGVMSPAEIKTAAADAKAEAETQTALISQLREILSTKGIKADHTLEDAIVTGTLTAFADDAATAIGAYAFAAMTALKTVDFPNATVVRESAFYQSGLITANLPKVTTITGNAFRESAMVEADFPLVTGTTGNWYGCKSLVRANFPKATTIGSFNLCSAMTECIVPLAKAIPGNGLRGCNVLPKVDFQGSPTINDYGLADNPLLVTVILRGSTVATLANTNAFFSTPIASGTGYIYVPASLVDSYKAATNWSTFAAQIRAIENYPDITGG